MTEAEVKKILDANDNVGGVLMALEDIARQGYVALMPRLVNALDSPNETYRATAIAAYFNFMTEEAVRILPRAYELLCNDESPMVRGAAASAISYLWRQGTALAEPARVLAKQLRAEPVDSVRHTIYYALFQLARRRRGDIPWELTVEQVDWALVDDIVTSLGG